MPRHEKENKVTWTETIERYLAEGRTVSGGKYDKEKQLAEQRQKTQDAYTKKAFDTQMSTINDIKASMSKYLTGSMGFDPALTAAIKTKLAGDTAKEFSGARSSVVSALARRGSGGGTGPVGGDFAKAFSFLKGSEADTTASNLTNLNIADLQQAINNKFNAASVLSGNAATLNSPISTFTGSGDNALDQRIKVGLTPGFGANLLNSFASGFGSGLGDLATGGVGSLATGIGKMIHS